MHCTAAFFSQSSFLHFVLCYSDDAERQRNKLLSNSLQKNVPSLSIFLLKPNCVQFVGNWNHIFHLTFQNENLWGKRSNKAVTIWSSIIISVVGVVPHLKKVTPKVYQACVTINIFTSLLLFQTIRTAETSVMLLVNIIPWWKRNWVVHKNKHFLLKNIHSFSNISAKINLTNHAL